MKKNLLAAAVASTLVAPMAVSADDAPNESTWYGRISTVLQHNSVDGGSSNTAVKGAGSRFGVKGSQDLGNGMSGLYRYEFQVDSATARIRAEDGRRLAYVGLKGGFGQVLIGSQWSAPFIYVGTYMEPWYYHSAYAYSGQFRLQKSISYSNSFGPVSMQLDLQFDGDNANSTSTDSVGVGVGVTAGPATLGFAYTNQDGGASADTKYTGLAFSVPFGNVTVGGGWNKSETGATETDGATVNVVVSSGKLTGGIGFADYDGGSNVILHGRYNFSGSTAAYTEIQSLDNDASADETNIVVGLRKGF